MEKLLAHLKQHPETWFKREDWPALAKELGTTVDQIDAWAAMLGRQKRIWVYRSNYGEDPITRIRHLETATANG